MDGDHGSLRPVVVSGAVHRGFGPDDLAPRSAHQPRVGGDCARNGGDALLLGHGQFDFCLSAGSQGWPRRRRPHQLDRQQRNEPHAVDRAPCPALRDERSQVPGKGREKEKGEKERWQRAADQPALALTDAGRGRLLYWRHLGAGAGWQTGFRRWPRFSRPVPVLAVFPRFRSAQEQRAPGQVDSRG